MKVPRIRLTKDEFDLIKEFRSNHRALLTEADKEGFPPDQVAHYWLKSKNMSVFVKPTLKTYDHVRDAMIEQMSKYSPNYPEIKRKPSKDGHLLVIDPADIHFGKLATAYECGEDYDIKIAEKRVLEGVSGILDKTNGFNIDKIALIIGNDILHIDNHKRTTTSGTPQDTDGMWFEAFLRAKDTIVSMVETLMSVADLHIIYNPSNHDYMSGFYLADSIYSWFRNSKNITFDFSISHRKYFRYGNSLIGTTHGDGAKQSDLPLLMATESAKDWVNSKHRYYYIHHWHHKASQDFIGVTVEKLRSPSGTDSWHHRNGYQHAPKAIEAFIHSKEHGQVARISHIF